MTERGQRLLWLGLCLLTGCGGGSSSTEAQRADGAALTSAVVDALGSAATGSLAAVAASDYHFNGVTASDLSSHPPLWIVTGTDVYRVDRMEAVEVLVAPVASRGEPSATRTVVRMRYRYVRDDLPNGPAGIWVRGVSSDTQLDVELTGRLIGDRTLLTAFRPITLREERRYYYDTDDDPMYQRWIEDGEPAGLRQPLSHRDLVLNAVNIDLSAPTLMAGTPQFTVAPGGTLSAAWTADNLERPIDGPGAAPLVPWPGVDGLVSVPPYSLAGFRGQPVPDYPGVGANAARTGSALSIAEGRVVAPGEAGIYTAWISAVNRWLNHLEIADGRRVGQSQEERLSYYVPYRVAP